MRSGTSDATAVEYSPSVSQLPTRSGTHLDSRKPTRNEIRSAVGVRSSFLHFVVICRKIVKWVKVSQERWDPLYTNGDGSCLRFVGACGGSVRVEANRGRNGSPCFTNHHRAVLSSTVTRDLASNLDSEALPIPVSSAVDEAFTAAGRSATVSS